MKEQFAIALRGVGVGVGVVVSDRRTQHRTKSRASIEKPFQLLHLAVCLFVLVRSYTLTLLYLGDQFS